MMGVKEGERCRRTAWREGEGEIEIVGTITMSLGGREEYTSWVVIKSVYDWLRVIHPAVEIHPTGLRLMYLLQGACGCWECEGKSGLPWVVHERMAATI